MRALLLPVRLAVGRVRGEEQLIWPFAPVEFLPVEHLQAPGRQTQPFAPGQLWDARSLVPWPTARASPELRYALPAGHC
jgi:hypothetical protein